MQDYRERSEDALVGVEELGTFLLRPRKGAAGLAHKRINDGWRRHCSDKSRHHSVDKRGGLRGIAARSLLSVCLVEERRDCEEREQFAWVA